MSSEKYYVASIGLEEKDQQILLTMLALSKNRAPSFVLFESGGNKKSADILLVDADNPKAIKRWAAYLDNNKQVSKIMSVMLCDDVPPPNPNDHNRYVKKPMSATLLLSTLEKLVMEEISQESQQLFTGDNKDTKGNDEPVKQVDSIGGEISALVVDDSLPVRIQMKKALHNIAKKVDFAETGEEAQNLITKNTYDIIFLDVILPGVDGYDICKFIKKNKNTSNTPVIMLTSNTSPADRMKGKMAGCDTYLIKPVRHDIFKEVIYEYLEIEV